MGATLSRPYKIGKPLAPTDTVYRSLLRAERTSFIGCPAELMFLILSINWRCWSRLNTPQTSDSSPSSTHFTTSADTSDKVELNNSALLERIKAFEPDEWAVRTTLFTPQPDTQERKYLARAYQSAVLIYFHRVIEPISHNLDEESVESDTSLVVLAHTILVSLSLIEAHHPFIKCIIWPTFIAGAELISVASFAPSSTVNPSKLLTPSSVSRIYYRDLTRHLLYLFWLGYRCINVVNAAKLLEKIWKKNDEIAHSMSKEEYDRYERRGVWSQGVLNCADIQGPNRWKDYWIGDDVDWLFV